MNYRKRMKHKKSRGTIKTFEEKIITGNCVVIIKSCDPKTKVEILNGR